jgi:hypothetical protein
MNEFEQRLRRVPGKPIPADWRAEILAAAMPIPAVEDRGSWFDRLRVRIHAVLWPHPQAWAGLAAVWVVILLLHFSQRDESPVPLSKSAPPSPALLAELRQQQQLLAELLGGPAAPDADRPRTRSPRTQSVRILMA